MKLGSPFWFGFGVTLLYAVVVSLSVWFSK